MPYVSEVKSRPAESRGQLAYWLSHEIANYVRFRGLEFRTISDVRGAVAAALNEFERRVAEPYEQTKLEGGGADPYAPLAEQVKERLAEQRAANTADFIRRHDERRKAPE